MPSPRAVGEYQLDYTLVSREVRSLYYDPGWVGRAERMKQIDVPAVRDNLREMTASQFKYFLQDMRRRVGLAVPASADDAYTAAALYPPFLRWAREHPRDARATWATTLDNRHQAILSFRHNGDGNIPDNQIPSSGVFARILKKVQSRKLSRGNP